MKVMVTGATGVIGRRAIPLLLAAGHEVTAVGRNPERLAALQRLGATIASFDLFDTDTLRERVAGHEGVINLATHIPSPFLRMLLPGAWTENDRVRREGSRNLVNAAIAGGASRFVQESFAPVYPDRADSWIDENVPLAPLRHTRTVLDAERAAARFTARDRAGVVLRFAAFYGPDARHLEEMLRLVRHGFAPMPGPAQAFISSVSHDDAAAAVVAALDLPSGTYNVVDDEPVSHREYCESLAEALGLAPPLLPPAWSALLFGSAGRLLARSLRISNRKLRGAANYRPSFPSVREGWRALADRRRAPSAAGDGARAS